VDLHLCRFGEVDASSSSGVNVSSVPMEDMMMLERELDGHHCPSVLEYSPLLRAGVSILYLHNSESGRGHVYCY
jgi:hypothetical protein